MPRPRVLASVGLALSLAASAAPAGAFCGFYVSGSGAGLYNKATRVSLMRQGTRTVLAMSNDYEGPPEDFAMVVPVPVVLSRESVRALPHDVFDHVEALTAPRLVEYWEQDPCPQNLRNVPGVMGDATRISLQVDSEVESESARPETVRVEARFAVGEYDVVILSATESSGLESWLREHRYNVPAGAAPWLAPYVRGGWRFFVAKVDVERAARRPGGGVRLSPLRMHYDAAEFRLPVRLGLLNAPPGAQDLIVYVLHPTARFEVANQRNVFIPTGLRVAEGVRGEFPGFYAALFDATLQSAGARAVVTEYAWSTGGCDPCPASPLDARDLATLGADVLEDFQGSSMVVTRLHARYNAATLTDDLVFREAFPVASVSAARGDPDATAEAVRLTAQGNRFQARYVIRHPWTGPATCEHPRRGVWGGPPGGRGVEPVAARELAEAPRGAVALPSLVMSAVPGVDLGARLALPDPASAPASPPPARIPATGVRRGCACEAGPPSPPRGPLAATALALAACALRRQMPKRRRSETSARASSGQ